MMSVDRFFPRPGLLPTDCNRKFGVSIVWRKFGFSYIYDEVQKEILSC